MNSRPAFPVPSGQIVPSGRLRWVMRALPPRGDVPLDGVTLDKTGATDRGAARAAPPAERMPVLEMHVVELDTTGQPCSQAWLPVPFVNAEDAEAQDKREGIGGAGLLVVAR